MTDPESRADEVAALVRAAREAHVEVHLLVECVERRLVDPGSGWDDEAIETARRIRRLTTLGVNLSGIEVILHMRRRVLALHEERARRDAELRRARRLYDEEVARLVRERAADPDRDG